MRIRYEALKIESHQIFCKHRRQLSFSANIKDS